MLKKLALMALCIFSICNQSIQASNVPCTPKEMCRYLIHEASKRKVTNMNDVAIVCCVGCTACCCLCLADAVEAQDEPKKLTLLKQT